MGLLPACGGGGGSETGRGVGAVFVLAVGNLKTDQAAVYISLLCSPPEAQVCVAAPSVGSRALDD